MSRSSCLVLQLFLVASTSSCSGNRADKTPLDEPWAQWITPLGINVEKVKGPTGWVSQIKGPHIIRRRGKPDRFPSVSTSGFVELCTGDGKADVVCIGRRESTRMTVYIILDEEWKRELDREQRKTLIAWSQGGASHPVDCKGRKEFDFTRKKMSGLYVDRILFTERWGEGETSAGTLMIVDWKGWTSDCGDILSAIMTVPLR
jgi:hypothetical protein